MAATKKRKCPSCGSLCGGTGRKGGCKFAANENKRLADQLWEAAKATVKPKDTTDTRRDV